MNLTITTQFLSLLLGLYFVVKGADVLLSSATSLGKKFNVSDFFIGLIIIGFGTSLSELLVSVKAVLENSPGLSVGNVVGSNISNIILVISFVLIISSFHVKNIRKFDIFFHLLIHLLFLLFFLLDILNLFSGIFFIFLFLFYLFLSFIKSSSKKIEKVEIEDSFPSKMTFQKPIVFGIPIIFLSIIITLFGAQITVLSAIKISSLLNISDSFLGLSVIAIGTSLPEIATSIKAARKKNFNLIVGNILGSNIYNLLLILGISASFENFTYNKNALLFEVYFLSVSVTIISILFYKNFLFKKNHSVIFFMLYFFYLFMLYRTNF